MFKLLQYYGRAQGAIGNLGALPPWAKFIVAIFALPGIIAVGLSIVVFLVSLIALSVLTLPVYVLLKRLTGSSRGDEYRNETGFTTQTSVGPADIIDAEVSGQRRESPASGRRQVEVRIIESEETN